MTSSSSHRIRDLNDAFRRSFGSAQGVWVMTRGIHDMGADVVTLVVAQIMAFDSFSEDNDPYGEHDFGSINVAGETIFWKIDYYDQRLEFGSEDPADPAKTQRVLTIMLASEY